MNNQESTSSIPNNISSNNVEGLDDQSNFGYSRNGSMRSKHMYRDDVSVAFQDHYSNIQKIHQHPETGLTTNQASEKLIDLIQNILNEKEMINPFPTFQIMKKELFKVTSLLYILGVVMLVVAYGLEAEKGIKSAYIIVEAVLLLAFILLHLFMHIREQRLEHNETIAKARGHLQRYIKYGDVLQDGVTVTSESISLVSVCRDERWRKIPLNMLVEGDLVSLREGEKAQVALQCIEPSFREVHFAPNEIYTSETLGHKLQLLQPDMQKEEVAQFVENLFNSGRCCFQVKYTPMIKQIEMSIDEPSVKRPINPVINAINYIYVVIERFLWISVGFSLLANIFRSIFQSERNLVDLLIIRQANLIIAFSFVMLPCVLLLITYSIGHAKLLALFDVLQERSLKGEISDSHPALNFDTDYSDDKIPDIPFKLMINYWEAILSSKHVAFSHSSNLLHHVASTTVICCIDKDGIVSEPVNTVNEICFLEDEPVCLELSAEYTHTQYSISFNDSSWKDHINALKPLGLDCLLNRTCRIHSISPNNSRSNSMLHHLHHSSQVYSSDQASKIQLIRDREVSSDTNTQCLCLLAKEIGFSEDVSNQFIKLKEIHTLTQHHQKDATKQSDSTSNLKILNSADPSPYMISQVAKDISSETLQLLSKGSTDLVIEHCQLYWDGETIRVFDDAAKEKVKQIYHKWVVNEGLSSISFAYKPIENKFKKLFTYGSINSPLVDVRFSNSNLLNLKSPQKIEIPSISQNSKNLNLPNSLNINNNNSSNNMNNNNNNSSNNSSSAKSSDIQQTTPPPTIVNKKIKNNLLSPKSDIIIVVESPLHGSGSAELTPKPRKKPFLSGDSYLKPKSLVSKLKKKSKKLKSDPISLPPVELEYESGDDLQKSQPPSPLFSKRKPSINENNNIQKVFAKDKPTITITNNDDEEEEEDNNNNNSNSNEDVTNSQTSSNDESNSVSSEYSNNDSETESDVFSKKDDSYSVSETSESDVNNNNNNNNKKNRHLSLPKSKKPDNNIKKNKSNKKKNIIKNKSYDEEEDNEMEENLDDADKEDSQLVVTGNDEDEEIQEIKITTMEDDTKIVKVECQDEEDDEDILDGSNPILKINDIDNQDALEQLQMNQIFIGMVGMKELPKSHANHFIEVLRNAGIRFVYFSDKDRRSSNGFVNKLGLETDWNCCISLRDPGPDEVQIPDGPSKLPRGISSVRKHLEEVDNVPLLVPMFSDCTPQSKEEMIKILQENGEVVCCIGSALNYENTNIFCQSDLAFSLEPAVTRCLGVPLSKSDPKPLLTSRNFFETKEITHHLPMNSSHIDTKRVPSEYPSTHSLCTDITSLPCSLIFHRRTDFNEILKFFHVGRQLLTNTRQCLLFILSASMSLVLMTFLGGILALSMTDDRVIGEVPLTGLQLMWLEFIIIPILGFSLLATPEDPNLMKTLSPKNNSEFKHIPTFARYIAIRLVPSILLTTFFFLWSLHSLTGVSWANIFGGNLSEWSDHRSSIPYSHALLVSQNIMMFAFVYYLCITSISFIHHTQSIRTFNPLNNHIWVLLVLLSLGLQVAFSFVSLKVIDGIHLLTHIGIELYIILFCWAIMVILLDEFVKRLYKKWFDDLQLELRLEFDTKLGMHSPI
ncbi:putative transmembrane protein [Tieghemostelium lacteum]|uniref:Putative transmembrane protein n=1 Tax=Tieghemostelium lacteum TaxID=361077 RepID=A0A152A9N1_TIELA|nr:putative transmembrane protein [Tieghemostelium lacteum]|eukprot:KYR02932.1 putative transmembrane protein [Tieghemostelium lacteum]